MQEGKRRRLDLHFIGNAPNLKTIECLHGRLRLTLCGTKCGEVMFSDERLGGVIHRLCIQVMHDMPHFAFVQHRRRAAHQDAIEIMPPGGGESRVKIWRRNGSIKHRNRRRSHKMIQRIAYAPRGKFLLKIEMRHLAQRMHARIGAAGPVHGDAFAGKLLDRVLQRALNRAAIVLSLPADEFAAVIFQS